MRLQLDTDSKTIKIEEKVNLKEFFELLEKILPDGKWKEFDLEVSVISNWYAPIIVEPLHPVNPDPFQNPWIVTCNDQPVKLNSGKYNIEAH